MLEVNPSSLATTRNKPAEGRSFVTGLRNAGSLALRGRGNGLLNPTSRLANRSGATPARREAPCPRPGLASGRGLVLPMKSQSVADASDRVRRAGDLWADLHVVNE